MRWMSLIIISVCTNITIWVVTRSIYSCEFELCAPHVLILTHISESKISSATKMNCHLDKMNTEAF